MAGLGPPGSVLLGAFPDGGNNFRPGPATFTFLGFAPTSVMLVVAPRVSNFSLEVLHGGLAEVWDSWFGLEIMHAGAADVRVSAYDLEIMHSGAAQVRVSGMYLEILRSVEDAEIRRARLLFAGF